MKVVVTRPRAQAGPLVERLEALGHEVGRVPADRDRAARRADAGRRRAATTGSIVTSPNGARRARAARAGDRAAHRRDRARDGGGARASAGSSPPSSPRVSTQEGLLAEFPRPAGRVLFAGAEGARRLLVDALGADFVPLYRTRAAPADAARRATSSCSRPARPRARTRALGARRPRSRSARRRRARPRGAGLEVVAEARHARSRRARRRRRA